MATYQSNKIVELIDQCIDKHSIERNESGMISLNSMVFGEPSGYIITLYSESKIQRRGFVVKSWSKINMLLKFAGFNSWDDFLNSKPA